jgi:AcrR family transcriptional regulator
MPKDTFFNLNGEKREKVMRAAVGEFTARGFEKGNVGEIAKRAGVAKGSMYQYFENKRELFMYAVHWAVELFLTKYEPTAVPEDMDIFDYFYESSRQIIKQIATERELAVFIQEVFLGRYPGLTDASIDVMLKASDAYILKLIQDGKKNGSIRRDIDDTILAMFMIGASMKIKENILNRAKNAGADIIGEDYSLYEADIGAMLELLKNGMGEKSCS